MTRMDYTKIDLLDKLSDAISRASGNTKVILCSVLLRLQLGIKAESLIELYDNNKITELQLIKGIYEIDRAYYGQKV